MVSRDPGRILKSGYFSQQDLNLLHDVRIGDARDRGRFLSSCGCPRRKSLDEEQDEAFIDRDKIQWFLLH
jgi:hypothetical protein